MSGTYVDQVKIVYLDSGYSFAVTRRQVNMASVETTSFPRLITADLFAISDRCSYCKLPPFRMFQRN